MPELSIIVPVYKVEKYLPKCIDSILAQTFTDFELILIDDGSPDRCGEICDEYAAKDARVIVIHQENRGVSAARNAGLDVAQGKYIGFVDSDDWIEPEMYELLIEKAHETQADLVVCGINSHRNESGDFYSNHLSEGDYSKDELLQDLFMKPCKLGGSCCNRVFRRENIQGLRFNSDFTLMEDREFLFRCFLQMQKAVKIQQPLYNVRINPESATRKPTPDTLFQLIHASKSLIPEVKQYSQSMVPAAIDNYIDDCFLYSKKLKKEYDQSFFLRFLKLRFEILQQIMYLSAHNMCSKAKIHGYLYSLLNL